MNYDSHLTDAGTACSIHALIRTLRHVMRLDHEDMSKRTRVTEFDGRSCVAFFADGLVHDGRNIVCENVHNQSVNQPAVRYSGSSSIMDWLAGDRIFTVCRRPKNGKNGWFNTSEDRFDLALKYAYQCPVCSEAACLTIGHGTFYSRPVINAFSHCWNSCGAGSSWDYTKLDCRRYAAQAVFFFPAWSCKDVPCIRPDAV